MNRSSQSGSHLVALGMGIVAVSVMAFAGYRVWMMQQPQPVASTNSMVAKVALPAKIASTTDLRQAASALDSASTQVNSTLDDSALNADLSSML